MFKYLKSKCISSVSIKKDLLFLLSTKSESSYAPGYYRLEDIQVTITKKVCTF